MDSTPAALVVDTIGSPGRLSADHRRRRRRLVAAGCVLAAVFATATLAVPVGRVDACRLSFDPHPVRARELDTIRDPNGAWAQRTNISPQRAPFVAAGKRVAIEYFAETDERSAGVTWQMSAAWGPATIVPLDYDGPVVKADVNYCYPVVNARQGDASYWLENASGVRTEIIPGQFDDEAIEAQLTMLFGAPTEVTDEMIAGATASATTSAAPPDDPLWVKLGVIIGATLAVAFAGGD